MVKYKRRPLAYDAFKWTNQEDDRLPLWFRAAVDKGFGQIETINGNRVVTIETEKGVLIVEEGDWITLDERGRMYAVKGDVFEMLFEVV